jgi:trk system potassium uptake protein TrkA
MIAEIAREYFNVNKIISRLYNLDKEIVYKGLDIKIIRPAELAINEFKNILQNE